MPPEIKDISELTTKKGEISKVSVSFLLGDFVFASSQSDENIADTYADRAWDVYTAPEQFNDVNGEKLNDRLLVVLLSEINAFDPDEDEPEIAFQNMHSFHPTGGDDLYTDYVRNNTMDVLDELHSELDEQGIEVQNDIDSLLDKHAGTHKAEIADQLYVMRDDIQKQKSKTMHMLEYIERLQKQSLSLDLDHE